MPAKGSRKPPPPKQEMAQVNKNADPKKKNFYEQYSGMVAPGSSSSSPALPDHDSDNDSDPDFHNDGAGLLLNPPTNATLPSSKGKANADSDDDEEEEFNAETMLYAAADDVYFSTKRKRSLASMKTTFMKGSGSSGIRATNTPGRDKERNIFRRVKGWYSPMYDYRSPNMTEEERRKPRYCGAALKRWQFVLVHFAAV
ncbi:hypothetical protein BC829DRAFT_488928 [Chytridium lagenaria]|nr:hypothetical protein BC829DRAFT_488928 [Chytridium lagenaria]